MQKDPALITKAVLGQSWRHESWRRSAGTAGGRHGSAAPQWLPAVTQAPAEQQAEGLRDCTGACMATPGRGSGGDVSKGEAASPCSRALGGGTAGRERERERELSRTMKRTSAILGFHLGARQKPALGVNEKQNKKINKRFGSHLIFDSRQQLWLSPNHSRADGLVQGPGSITAPSSRTRLVAALVPLSQPHTLSQPGEPRGSRLSLSSRNPPCPHPLSFAFSTEPCVGTGRCHCPGSRTALVPLPVPQNCPYQTARRPASVSPLGRRSCSPPLLSPGSR